MEIRMKDVRYVKCKEYSPLSRKADALGMKTFWRADITEGAFTHSIAYGDTKAECREDARRYIAENNK